MKHHVILLVDSIQIPGSYITEEWNAASIDENGIPYQHLNVELHKLTFLEVREYLGSECFIKREFCPPPNPDSISCDPELLKEIGGSASLVEIVLSGTALITLFFFKTNGLPKYQKVFELQIPEE